MNAQVVEHLFALITTIVSVTGQPIADPSVEKILPKVCIGAVQCGSIIEHLSEDTCKTEMVRRLRIYESALPPVRIYLGCQPMPRARATKPLGV